MYDRPNPKVLVTVRDIGLAIDLIKVFFEVGIDAYWTTEEQGQKLAQVWNVEARI